MLTVIVPTLNVETSLKRLLATLEGQVVVSDGGSTDGTAEMARAVGTKVVCGLAGRGQQLAVGANAAEGEWLLFLHADSVPGEGWREAVSDFTEDPVNEGRAGYFRLRFDDEHRAARRLEKIVAWRSRVLGLPYGDQGLLIHRSLYDAVGGYRPLELMEDVDLVRRVGKRRLVALDAEIVTSAERYQRDGWWLRSARNLFCLGLYFCRVPPKVIRKFYG